MKKKASKLGLRQTNPNRKVSVSGKTKKNINLALKQYSTEYGKAMSKLANE